MTTLSTRTAPSLYSGMILALIALALALEASFLAGLAWPGGTAGRSILLPAVIDRSAPSAPASSPAPCAIG